MISANILTSCAGLYQGSTVSNLIKTLYDKVLLYAVLFGPCHNRVFSYSIISKLDYCKHLEPPIM